MRPSMAGVFNAMAGRACCETFSCARPSRALTIFSCGTLVLTVTKKQAQIAMLKTMGLADWKIILVFVWQGLQNGLLGVFWGALAGMGLAWLLPDAIAALEALFAVQVLNDDIYFVSRIPSTLRWQDVTLVCSVALSMSLLATLYPAWRATRIEPARALHGSH